jgi:hypothetical protein
MPYRKKTYNRTEDQDLRRMMKSIYRSEEGKKRILELYDAQLSRLTLPYRDIGSLTLNKREIPTGLEKPVFFCQIFQN